MIREPALDRKSVGIDRRPLPPAMVARKSSGSECSGAHALRQRVGNQGIQRLMGDIADSSNGGALVRSPAIQAQLRVNEPADAHEQEANRVANAMMRMPSPGLQETPAGSPAASLPNVQRLCAECDEELGKKPGAQVRRKQQTAAEPFVTPSAAANIHAMRGGGRALPVATRAFFEPRFGANFSNVRVHTDTRAQETADSIGARAFTSGNDIGFGSGEYSPESHEGQRLLAHELTHVVQQQESGTSTLQRKDKKKDEEKGNEKPPAQSGSGATRYKQIRMRFNGSELIVYGDGAELFRYGASSGRPIMISEKDARECGGDPRLDTYMSPRFAGIEDHGPIPEGVFQFQPPQIQPFTTGEQLSLLWGGIAGKQQVTVQGHAMHPGDWGAGRVPLNKVRIEGASCGNPHKRHSFFLHGGLLAGSSGCIDIGGSFDELRRFCVVISDRSPSKCIMRRRLPVSGSSRVLVGQLPTKAAFIFATAPRCAPVRSLEKPGRVSWSPASIRPCSRGRAVPCRPDSIWMSR
jgi:uncharacterized protein DUF4157